MKLDEHTSIKIALHLNGNNLTYFSSFGVEYISVEIYKFIKRIKML